VRDDQVGVKTMFRFLLVLSLGFIISGCASGVAVGTRHHHIGVAGSAH